MKRAHLLLIRKRKWVQLLFGWLFLWGVLTNHISLWIILLIGAITGVVFGKVFCRWMCPMGFIMELMMGGDENSKNIQLYNYHKMGCPIAWIGGFLNKFSVFSIRRDKNTCTDCGLCDSKCYIAKIDEKHSLYKSTEKNPSESFSCSKCLSCVEGCPTGSLKYTIKKY